MGDKKQRMIVISGPTASGKSALALALAEEIGGVIINADSQQVYREIPIISAQPSEKEKELVPHKLYGAVSGAEDFSVAKWLDLAVEQVKLASSEGGLIPIFTGGTGLYLAALFHGLSPVPEIPASIRDKVRAMEKEDVIATLGNESENGFFGNDQRLRRALEVKMATGKHLSEFHKMESPHIFKPEDFTILDMNVSRETIYENIDRRFLAMMENGAVEEVADLLKLELAPALPVMKAVGVREIAAYLEATLSKEEAIAIAQQKSRNYAKRQMTWFRNQMPEHTVKVANVEEALALIRG